MSNRTALRVRTLPRFPISIKGTNGITVVKDGVNVVVKPDYGALVQANDITDPDNTFMNLWNSTADVYSRYSFSDFVENVQNVVLGPVQLAFADVATATASVVPANTNRIRTQVYSIASGKGGAYYRPSDAGEVTKYPTRGWFTTNSGTKYWLLDEVLPTAFMFGAYADGVTDDTQALQALLNFYSPPAQIPPANRNDAMAGGGIVLIPRGLYRTTQPLRQNAFVRILGQGEVQFPQPFTLPGNQVASPNATIIMPDFAPADRTYGVGIQTSPYVLTLVGASAGLTGQVVGTQFKSIQSLEISGTDIDNGCISYCEGADISNLTIWPVNQIFAGIRWTAAAGSRLSQVSIRNVNRGIMTESAWESEIHFPRVYDFSDYGIYNGGNLHAVQILGGWIHAGNRVLNGLSGGVWTVKPVGIFANYFSGFVVNATAVDECFTAFSLSLGSGARLIGIHSERTLGTWLITNGAYNISASGCAMIQNVIDARTFTNSLVWDGNDCSVDIDVICNVTGSGPAANPGKTYFQGTNPNTGAATNLSFGTGNNVSAIFRNMPKLAADASRVNRLTGNICFINDNGIYQIGGSANSNSYVTEVDIRGDAGVQRVINRKINGVRSFYEIETATTWKVFEDTTNTLLTGFDGADNSIFFGGGAKLLATFGTPETFTDGPPGSICVDTANFRIFTKTTAAGTLTGWRPMLPHLQGTTANRPTTQLFTGMMYFDTTLNKPIWRNAANTGWVDATGTAA